MKKCERCNSANRNTIKVNDMILCTECFYELKGVKV